MVVVDLSDEIDPSTKILNSIEFAARIRKEYQLDNVIPSKDVALFIFPETLYNMSFTFFMSLFQNYLQLLGKERFEKRFQFQGSRSLLGSIRANIETFVVEEPKGYITHVV